MSPSALPHFPDLTAMRQAVARVRSIVPPSPLVPSRSLSTSHREVRLKLESLCPTGSFKIRGATNVLSQIGSEDPGAGVITQSSGNHGRAVAYVAQRLGLSATVCLSTLVPEVKRRAIETLGARVVVSGQDQDAAYEVALDLAHAEGLRFIPAFDDAGILCGQATLAIELLEQWPDVDTLLVPLSGGGLIGGVALAVQAINPAVSVIGVTVDHGAAMADSLEAGRIVGVDERPSYADALPGGLPSDNRYTFEICRRWLDGVLRVPEDQIADAMVYALRQERLVLEGGGAIGLAPLLGDGPPTLSGERRRVAVVCSGSNVDIDTLLDLARDRR